jgi:GNAT superfamily N-acetyltransferase
VSWPTAFETGFDHAKSISANADELRPPAGVFVIARLHGQPIGCGALKVKDRKIGRRILEKLEALAQELGVRKLRLETNRSLKEAQALYRKCGS